VNKNVVIIVMVVLAMLALIVFAGLAVVGYFYQDDVQSLLGVAKPKNIAQILPENTELFISMTPNIQALAGYENLKALYLDNPDVERIFNQAEDSITNDNGITFKDDISPWLGKEMVLAVPSFSEMIASEMETAPDFIAIAETRDKQASDAAVQKFLSASDSGSYTEEIYQEATLYKQTQTSGDYEEMIITTFDEFVAISTNDTLVKDMIDRSKGSDAPSFVSNQRYQKVLNELPASSIGMMYLDMTGVIDPLLDNPALATLDATQKSDIETLEAIGFAGLLQSNGIQLDMAITYDEAGLSDLAKQSLKQPASPNEILNEIPADALFSFNGFNLKNVWDQSKVGLEQNPDFQEQMTDLETEMGFDIEQDLFSWMTGEFAMVVIPVEPPNEFAPPVGGYLLIGSEDVEAAKTGVNNIMGAFQEEMGPFMEFERQTIGGTDFNMIPDMMTDEPMGGYGFHNDYLTVVYPASAAEILTSASENSILTNERFQATQDRLPTANAGYFFMNVDSIREMAEAELVVDDQEYQENVEPLVKPIHIFASANDIGNSGNGVSKGSMFLLISE